MSQQDWRRFTRTAVATAATAALVMLGAVAGSTTASAETAYGNIDPEAEGTIYIHKHQHQTETPIVQGSPATDTPLPSAGVGDVIFTVYPLLKDGVAIDLTDPEAWDQLEGLTPTAPCTAPAGYTLGTGTPTPATDLNGDTSLGNLGIGVYVVCETSAPSSVVDHAMPFIVTIPFPYEQGWLYSVHTYPKNGVTGVSKTITPQEGLGLGSVVKFPVTANVPSLPPGGSFTSFDIVDSLDTKLTLSPAAAGVGTGVLSVTVDGVAVPSSYYGVAAVSQTVTVAFTAGVGGGLEWLATQQGKSVVVTFQGTVNTVGVIENDAQLFVNDPNHEKGITTNLVKSNWGDVLIKKVNARTPGETLVGAKFEVYPATAPYAADCSTATVLAASTAISVNGATVFETTGPLGQIAIPGLFVSDSVNPSVNATQRCYVLKEIEAPAGYVTPTGDAALFPVAVKTGTSTAVDVTVPNTQQRVPGLPLTGSTGTAVFMLGGLALILAAGGAALVTMRRRQDATKQ